MQCNLGTVNLGNLFLARTFPLDNYCLFAHVKKKQKKMKFI